MDVWIIYSKIMYEKKIAKGTLNTLIDFAKEYEALDLSILSDHLFSIVSDGIKNRIFYNQKELTKFPKIIFFKKYDMYLARQFELLGIKVLNSVESMTIARNKMKTYQILTEYGIKIPETIYISSGLKRRDYTYNDVKKILGTGKFVIKPSFGSKGDNIYLIQNEKEFDKVIANFKGICLFQKYIETEENGDLRTYVINSKYQGCAIRKNDEDFRTNFNLGAKVYRLQKRDEYLRELSVKAAEAIGIWYCAVDILKDIHGNYFVCEINSLPGRTRRINTNRRLINRLNIALKTLEEKH